MENIIIRVQDILDWLDGEEINYSFKGDPLCELCGFSSLKKYKKNTITWVKNSKTYDEQRCVVETTQPSCAIVQEGVVVDVKNLITTNNSKSVFFSILQHFWGQEKQENILGEGTVITDAVELGKNVRIGSNCSVIGDVTIGAGTVIENNVVIQGRVKIGTDCIIHSGTVIGGDGFGYCFDEKGCIEKVEHFGGVEIGDCVEIGCNACVDRGTIDDTCIGNNSKIDNLVHIAHNVCVGENVCVVAGAIVCGSVDLKSESYIAPGAIVKNQLVVGENALVGMGSVVTKSIKSNMVATGIPAKEIREVKSGDK